MKTNDGSIAWEVGISDAICDRIRSMHEEISPHISEVLLLSLQIRIAQSATIITVAEAAHALDINLAAQSYGVVFGTNFSFFADRALLAFNRDAVLAWIDNVAQQDWANLPWNEFLAPWPGVQASVPLVGEGSRWAIILATATFLLTSLQLEAEVTSRIQKYMSDDRPAISQMHSQCADIYSLRRVDLSRATINYRAQCINQLTRGLALKDGSDAEKARLQEMLAEVMKNSDARLKDGTWGSYTQSQFELFKKTRNLEENSNSEVIRALAEEWFDKESKK